MSRLAPYVDIIAEVVGFVFVIILPLLPAILLYLIFPKENLAEAEGPFQKLKRIKVSGPIAAYFIIALLAFWLFRYAIEHSLKEVVTLMTANRTLSQKVTELEKKLRSANREVWTVVGKADFDKNERRYPKSRIVISVRPPLQIGPTGNYEFALVMPTQRDAVFPSIMFQMEGYEPDEISLRPEGELGAQYEANAAAGNHTLHLRPAILVAEPTPTPPNKVETNPNLVRP